MSIFVSASLLLPTKSPGSTLTYVGLTFALQIRFIHLPACPYHLHVPINPSK
jgi:hypothetical protein